MDDATFYIYIISAILVFKYIEYDPDVSQEDELSEEEILKIRKEYEE